MKSNVLFKSAPLACVAASALVLITGCKSKEEPPVAYYSSGAYMGAANTSSQYESGAAPASSQAAQTQPTTGQAQAGGEAIIPLHQETLRVGTRDVDAGAVRIRKVVKTETVNQPVQVRRESLVVDRIPGDAAAQGGAPGASNLAQGQGQDQGQGQGSINTPFQEGEIVIRLKKQEPVVETQMVPAGRIVAQTRVNTDQVNVQKQVRKEDVEVVKEGNPENVTISQNLQASGDREASGAGPATGGSVAGAAAAAGAATDTAQQAISDLSQLTGAGDKSALAGRPVQLTSAKVLSVSPDRTLLSVGNDPSSKVWIRTGSAFEGIKEGDMVKVTGVVHTPAQSQSSFTEEVAQQLKSEPIYIEARTVEKANQ
jgi:stress response protein YsnF